MIAFALESDLRMPTSKHLRPGIRLSHAHIFLQSSGMLTGIFLQDRCRALAGQHRDQRHGWTHLRGVVMPWFLAKHSCMICSAGSWAPGSPASSTLPRPWAGACAAALHRLHWPPWTMASATTRRCRAAHQTTARGMPQPTRCAGIRLTARSWRSCGIGGGDAVEFVEIRK